MEGGELFSRIQERGDLAFTERGMCVYQGQRGHTELLCDAGHGPAPLYACLPS